ncbi:MAG: hypothetical protein U1B83_03135, partial [Candidatus Cloacimonadaceae bacterium]|nr:hypothetical protein [Candidatus Cloacimonadaceae bacterium]
AKLELGVPVTLPDAIEIARIRKLDVHHPGSGTIISWDGKDDAGSNAASGIYLIRVVQGDLSATQKVLKIR